MGTREGGDAYDDGGDPRQGYRQFTGCDGPVAFLRMPAVLVAIHQVVDDVHDAAEGGKEQKCCGSPREEADGGLDVCGVPRLIDGEEECHEDEQILRPLLRAHGEDEGGRQARLRGAIHAKMVVCRAWASQCQSRREIDGTGVVGDGSVESVWGHTASRSSLTPGRGRCYSVRWMVSVAKLVKAPGCGPGDRGFESLRSPHRLLQPVSDKRL